MRSIIAACIVLSILPGLALAQGKPGKGGAGGSGAIHDNGANRTPGDHSAAKGKGQQTGKQGGQSQQGNNK